MVRAKPAQVGSIACPEGSPETSKITMPFRACILRLPSATDKP